MIGRVVAQDMTASLGQNVLVENKAGANSLIATQEVKRAPPDGYTLMVTTLSHNVNAILLADKKPYDPIADFAPVSLVALLPLVMVTKPDSPFNSVQDVVKAAKAKPEEVSYGSAGNGGSAHLAGALLETLSGTRMTHVPFRGNAPALTEVMAGRVTFMFYPMIGIADQVEQKRLKALAVSTLGRHPDYPGRAHDGRIGLPGLRGVHPGARHHRARRHAGAGREATQRSGARFAREAGDEGEAEGARRDHRGRQHARGVPGVAEKDAERWERVIKTAGVKAE